VGWATGPSPVSKEKANRKSTSPVFLSVGLLFNQPAKSQLPFDQSSAFLNIFYQKTPIPNMIAATMIS